MTYYNPLEDVLLNVEGKLELLSTYREQFIKMNRELIETVQKQLYATPEEHAFECLLEHFDEIFHSDKSRWERVAESAGCTLGRGWENQERTY